MARPAPAARPAPPVPTRAAATPAAGVPRFAGSAPRGAPAAASLPARATDLVPAVLRAGGRPLDAAPRAELEAQLGHDLGQVRVHTGAQAAASAEAVGARAYAVGRHVVFGTGAYAPATADGRQLLVHEIVHTLQQGTAAEPAGTLRRAEPHAATEREAERIARAGPAPAARPVAVTAAPLQLAAAPAPATAAGRQRLEMAARLLQQTEGGPGMLAGLVADRTLIEFRYAAGGGSFFRFTQPLKQTDPSTWVRDAQVFEVYEVKAPDPAAPRVVLDERQSLGDLALELFRSQRRLRWAADDPQELARSVTADDPAGARSAYVQASVQAVAQRNVEQLVLKRDLERHGATVTTALPLEREFRAAHQAAFMAGMSRHGQPGKAAGEASVASRQALENLLTSGRLQTHRGETYATQFGRDWDEARAAWAQRNPQQARAGEERHQREAGIAALVELVRRVDPRSPEADQVIELVDTFAMLHGGTDEIEFIGRVHDALLDLLGPFGFRIVEGVGVGQLQRERLEYALLNFRALRPAQRAMVRRNPLAAGSFGINVLPTAAELQAKDRLVAVRTLPDGTLHTGTLAEFRWASDNNRINHILAQLAMIRSSGPGSLVGRILGGEKGAALGALVDAGIMLRAPYVARREQRRQAQQLGGGTTPPSPAPRVETIPQRTAAPARPPVPAPRPSRLAESEVIAANVRDRAAVQVQSPDVHQARWTRLGGEGNAPAAYRQAGGTVYLSSESWLVAPAHRGGIPPVRATPGSGAPAPAANAPQPASPAPARTAGRGPPDIAFDQTGLPDPLAQTPPAPVPAPSRQTQASGPRPRSRFNPELLPQPISEERVGRLIDLARYTVDAARHQQAWELLGGRGPAPPAFISEKVIYLDPTRWPRR